jgi:hypothetical protein
LQDYGILGTGTTTFHAYLKILISLDKQSFLTFSFLTSSSDSESLELELEEEEEEEEEEDELEDDRFCFFPFFLLFFFFFFVVFSGPSSVFVGGGRVSVELLTSFPASPKKVSFVEILLF